MTLLCSLAIGLLAPGEVWASASFGTELTGGVATGFTSNSLPRGIVAGPDAKIWFTEFSAVGRLSEGAISEFGGTSLVQTGPLSIAAGPDGNLWFSEQAADAMGRISPQGALEQFVLEDGGTVAGIAAGPDGNMWFTESEGPEPVGRFTAPGFTPVTHYTAAQANLTEGLQPGRIVPGPGGTLWFVEQHNPGAVAEIRFGPGNAPEFTEFRGGVTPGLSVNAEETSITAGPDGRVWFTERGNGGAIAAIDPVTNTVHEYKGFTNPPWGLVAGPDGNLWFTERDGVGQIGYMTTGGTINEQFTGGVTPGFSANRQPAEIVKGPDGKLWFVEEGGPGGIGSITFSTSEGGSGAGATSPTSSGGSSSHPPASLASLPGSKFSIGGIVRGLGGGYGLPATTFGACRLALSEAPTTAVVASRTKRGHRRRAHVLGLIRNAWVYAPYAGTYTLPISLTAKGLRVAAKSKRRNAAPVQDPVTVACIPLSYPHVTLTGGVTLSGIGLHASGSQVGGVPTITGPSRVTHTLVPIVPPPPPPRTGGVYTGNDGLSLPGLLGAPTMPDSIRLSIAPNGRSVTSLKATLSTSCGTIQEISLTEIALISGDSPSYESSANGGYLIITGSLSASSGDIRINFSRGGCYDVAGAGYYTLTVG